MAWNGCHLLIKEKYMENIKVVDIQEVSLVQSMEFQLEQ